MKIWISKYALTSGIVAIEAIETDRDMVTWKQGGYTQYAHGIGKEFHKTEADAVSRANEMRVKKIASLKKSIAKMEQLKFKLA